MLKHEEKTGNENPKLKRRPDRSSHLFFFGKTCSRSLRQPPEPPEVVVVVTLRGPARPRLPDGPDRKFTEAGPGIGQAGMEAKNRQTTRSKGGHRGGRGSSSDVERAVDDHPFCHSAATTSTTAAAADPLQTLDDSASTITTTAYYNYGGGGGGGGPNQIQNHSLVETASVLLNDDIIAGSPADGNRMS